MYPAVVLVVRICIRVSLPLSADHPKRPILGSIEPEVTGENIPFKAMPPAAETGWTGPSGRASGNSSARTFWSALKDGVAERWSHNFSLGFHTRSTLRKRPDHETDVSLQPPPDNIILIPTPIVCRLIQGLKTLDN